MSLQSPPVSSRRRRTSESAWLEGLRQHRWIGGIVTLAFVLRVSWLIIADPIPVSDFAQYLGSARDLVEYGSYGYPEPTAYRLPLYPIVLAGLILVRDSVLWLALWSVITSTVVCLLTYFVALRVGLAPATAAVSAFLLAILPQHVFFSPVLASEHLLAVLVMSAFLVATWSRLSPLWRASLSGLLVGAASLTRGDGIVFGLIVLGYLVFGTATDSSDEYRARSALSQVVVFGGCVLLVLSPWIIRNEIVMGRGTLLGSNSGQVFWYGHNPQGYGFIRLADTPMAYLDEVDDEREIQRVAWSLAFDYIRAHPESLVESTVRGTSEVFAPGLQNWGVFWSTRDGPGRGTRLDLATTYNVVSGASIAASWFLTIAAVLALVNPRAVGLRALALVGSVVGATWFFYSVVFLGNPRYRYMVDIFLSIAAAAVIVIVYRSARGTAEAATDDLASRPDDSTERTTE